MFGAGFICFTPQVGMIVPAIALLLAASPMTKDSRREHVMWGLVSVGNDKRVQLHGKGYFLDCACFFFGLFGNADVVVTQIDIHGKKIHHIPQTRFFFPSQSENLLPVFPNPHLPGEVLPHPGPITSSHHPTGSQHRRGAGGFGPGSQCLDVGSCTLDLEDGRPWCGMLQERLEGCDPSAASFFFRYFWIKVWMFFFGNAR